MMIDNYSMGDTVVRATAFLSGTKARPPAPSHLPECVWGAPELRAANSPRGPG
jgi:hypothetical protein